MGGAVSGGENPRVSKGPPPPLERRAKVGRRPNRQRSKRSARIHIRFYRRSLRSLRQGEHRSRDQRWRREKKGPKEERRLVEGSWEDIKKIGLKLAMAGQVKEKEEKMEEGRTLLERATTHHGHMWSTTGRNTRCGLSTQAEKKRSEYPGSD